MMDLFLDYCRDVFSHQDALTLKTLSDANLVIPESAIITLPSATNPGSKISEDDWWWPQELMPHFSPSQRCIRHRLPCDLRALGGTGLLETIKRFLVLSMVAPLRSPIRLPGLQVRQRLLNEFAGDMIARGKFSFSSLSAVDWDSLLDAAAKGRKNHTAKLLMHLQALAAYGHRGFIADFPGRLPSSRKDSVSNALLAEDEIADLDHDENFAAEIEIASCEVTYPPLSDNYVAQMGFRCYFYLNEIGPNLARIFANHPDLETNRGKWLPRGRNGPPKPSVVKLARSRAWKRKLENFHWTRSDGSSLTEIPFSCDALIFPPKKWEELDRLISRHVDAILHILLLLSGGRKSEILSLKRSVILRQVGTEEEFGIVDGRTMKPSSTSLGDKRNWPIPAQVVGWLGTQAVLAEALGPRDSDGFWWSMSTTHVGVARVNPYYRCTQFAERHGLSHLNDGNAHPHRYRKTIARLALLALTGAPMLVMEMFGHSDIMATMRYLLAEPNILADLREMLGERRAEVALNIVEDLDRSAGPATETLRSQRDRFFDELNIPLNERSQRVTLMQFVTAKLLDGAVDIKIIYPGVVCIRGLEQTGLCAVGGRQIDPAACQSKCRFRLDLSLRIDEVYETIEDLFDHHKEAVADQLDLPQKFFAAQILDQVEIFPEIKDHYRDDDRFLALTKQAV